MAARSAAAQKAFLDQAFDALYTLEAGAEDELRDLFVKDPVTCKTCRRLITLEGVHWVCRCPYPTVDPRHLGKILATGPIAV